MKLCCRNLSVKFSSAQAPVLDEISLEINTEELTAIMGANGSGKSTLALTLAGLMQPDSGIVILTGDGAEIQLEQPGLHSEIGLVFQNPDDQLLTSFVDREIALALEYSAIPRDQIVERVNKVMQKFGFASIHKAQPANLSGGQKQKLAMASMLVARPRFLILDETTSYLDPFERAAVLKLLKQELRQNDPPGVILITQFAREAMQADRLILIDSGKIIADGKPRDVFIDSYEEIQRSGIEIPIEIKLLKKAPQMTMPDSVLSALNNISEAR